MNFFQRIKQKGLLESFFESGFEESISPFLTANSRSWGKFVSLKASFAATFFLILSYFFSFGINHLPLSYLFLMLTYFLAGVPALISALEDIFSLKINIDVLMTLAAFFSILLGNPREGALLLVLFALSGAMEEAVNTRATSAISSLKKMTPSTAFVLLEDGSYLERSVKDIEIGSKIFIKSGQMIPLDGKVFQGASSVNMIHLTGEALPVPKKIGDEVAAGSHNLEGSLAIEVTRTSSDSTLSRIIRLITHAQEAKPKFQKWLDAFSEKYALIIIGLSFLIALCFPFILPIPFLGNEGSIYRSLAFLITASPCALVIAIPIAYLSSLSSCAHRGILLKGGVVLDAFAKCTAIAFDKTGTLTENRLQCRSLKCLTNCTEQDLNLALAVAAALEHNALHPIAKAIIELATEKKITPPLLEEFKAIPGYGLEAKYQKNAVFIGNPSYLEAKLDPDQKIALDLALKTENHLFTVLLFNNKLFLFTFIEVIRPGTKEQLSKLKEDFNLRLLMLTGDHLASAQSIAETVGIDTVYSNLKPEDKLFYIEKLAKTNTLAMVGDGINDAPALARAHVGISMGKVGSSTAVEVSDIVLLQDRLDLLHWLMKKAKLTKRIVKQNLTLAFAAIACAAFFSLMGFIPLWLAVVLHEGGTVLVGLNALRLLKK